MPPPADVTGPLPTMSHRLADRLLPRFVRDYLAVRPHAGTLARNAGWLMFDKLVRMGLALTVGAWVARHLGPVHFGELSYAVTMIVLCQGIANLGADGIVVRNLARTPQDAAAILGTALRLRLLTGLACWAFATALVYILRPHDTTAVLITGIIGASLVFQSADTVDLWFQSQSRNDRSVVAKLASYIVANAVRITLLLNDAPLWAFAAAVLIDAALLALALARVYRQFPVPQAWRHEWALGRRLLRESAPFMVSGLAALLYMRIDQLMIREILGEAALGQYSAAFPLSQVWNVVPVTLATALAPFIARKKAESEVAYMDALFKVFRVFAGLSLLVCLLTAWLAVPLVQLLYGRAYRTAADVLAVHVFSNVFIFLGVAQGLWLINEGMGRVTLYRTGLGALVSIAGNWVVLPRYGIVGAAAVTVVAQFVAVALSNLAFAPRILRLQLLAFMPFPLNRPPP